MSKKIYLVEDKYSLNILLEKYLKNEGYDVTTFSSGSCAKIRVNKLIERIYDTNTEIEDLNIQIGEYFIQKTRRVVLSKGKELQLTNSEFGLLNYLAVNKNNLILREKIRTNVWDINYFGSDRVIDDAIRRLRKKANKLTIETIYGHGYKLVVNL
ncbi:DNA-binding response regulator [Clostridium sp. WILCCON 0269]|uniref:DNA-binding response regulator n=1 Tax=Candidatus Clostridium eludens TaxID=3381663 RepID=A0ABW8SP46_9CLOT